MGFAGRSGARGRRSLPARVTAGVVLALGVAGCTAATPEVETTTAVSTVIGWTTLSPLPQTVTATVTESVAPVAESVTGRIVSLDPTSGELVYVRQIRVDPGDSAPYLADDPADPSEQRATLFSGAQVALIWSPCGTRVELSLNGVIPCSPADLAAVVSSSASQVLAELVVTGEVVTAVRERYQP